MNSAGFDGIYFKAPSLASCIRWSQAWRMQLYYGLRTATIEKLYLVLGRILVIIRNKSSWAASSKGGAQSTRSIFIRLSLSTIKYRRRCTAKGTDLDGLRGRRTHDLTAILQSGLTTSELWKDYGIVDGIMVRLALLFQSSLAHRLNGSRSHIVFHGPTFMNYCHLTFSTNLSKAYSRITSSHGWKATSKVNMNLQKQPKF